MASAPTRQPYRFTVEEYLAFERASDERHEYLDGVIYAMAGSASTQAMVGESEDHGTICMNLSISLGLQLRGTPCRAFSKDTKVRCCPYRSHTREGLYAYPDLVVVCAPSQYHDQARDVFELRYKETIDPDKNRWELCSRVLARKDVVEKLSESW